MKVLVLLGLMVTIALAEPPLTNQYLPPQQGFGPPSQSYGPPNGGQRQTDAVFRPRPSSNYGPPSRTSARRPTNQYIPPGNGLNQGLSKEYSSPRLPNQYVPPNQDFNGPNQGLLAPNRGVPSSEYGVPQGPGQNANQRLAINQGLLTQNRGDPSSEYGVPQGPGQRLSSQYLPPNRQSQRPSAEYGAPSVPGSQYGAPGFDDNQLGGGFGSSRNGGYNDDDGNDELANYSFEYMVKDEQSGNDFGHRETRDGARAVGVYYALLPDGRKQTVEYEADQQGYRPRISYEDTGSSPNGGYNQNAQSRNQQNYDNQGPY